MREASSPQRIPLRFRFYYWLMLHVYPHEHLFYRWSKDYRAWWGPR